MKSASLLAKRILIALAFGLLTLLVVEGALSLFTGQSLRPGPSSDFAPFLRTDEDGIAAASAIPGYYRVHKDPHVGYVLRYDEEVFPDGIRMVPDKLGMRARPGPPAPEGARRIAVLGDSVAFGVGLKDDETIAAQLERILSAVRGPDAPPVACRTVAMPGWNHRNAVRFLIDHFEVYDPDIVIYLPIPNDLADTLGVTESGHRRVIFDPASAAPLLMVNMEYLLAFKYYFMQRIAGGDVKAELDPDRIGPFALCADISRESARRYDENADSIAMLNDLCSRQGRRLLIGCYTEATFPAEYIWILRERLLDRGLDIHEVPLLERASPGLVNSKGDPHPNAQGAFALAVWIAEAILEQGWLPLGAGNPLPDAPKEAAEQRAPARRAEFIREQARTARRRAMELLQPEVNLETGRGFNQVLGGLNPDGTMSLRFLAALRAVGPVLKVRLKAILELPHLYPLDVAVEIDGRPVGTVSVPLVSENGESIAEGAFELPDPTAGGGAAVEVRLVPSTWAVHTFEGRSFVASCRVLSIACPSP